MKIAKKDIAIVFDCGATNVRVIAIDTSGQIVASETTANKTDADPHHKDGLIWDLDLMWQKLKKCAIKVMAQIDSSRIAGITVTTFGVDGTFVDKDGKLLYPVISWQCKRTQAIIDRIEKYISVEELYSVSGVYPYAFNTINKMLWFKENKPAIFKEAHRFLFLPSLFIQKLTGVFQNDATMAGTSMMNDLRKRTFSPTIFDKIEIDVSVFGSLAEPGDRAGTIHKEASIETGIPIDTPVFFAGHDSQFAIFGSGAELCQPVLSSGTWEVLMARTSQFSATGNELAGELTTETDVQPGIYNIGQNWLGSGVLEWFLNHFCSEIKGENLYETIIGEAEQIQAGTHGLYVEPGFYKNTSFSKAGSISGLTINTTRAEIYLAMLESLAFRLREGLEAIEKAGNFTANQIICVGGGSKNRLWNQLRADVCNIPIQLIDQKETTVLGAALFVFAGAGLFSSVEKARKNIEYKPTLIQASNNASFYQDLYTQNKLHKKSVN